MNETKTNGRVVAYLEKGQSFGVSLKIDANMINMYHKLKKRIIGLK